MRRLLDDVHSPVGFHRVLSGWGEGLEDLLLGRLVPHVLHTLKEEFAERSFVPVLVIIRSGGFLWLLGDERKQGLLHFGLRLLTAREISNVSKDHSVVSIVREMLIIPARVHVHLRARRGRKEWPVVFQEI